MRNCSFQRRFESRKTIRVHPWPIQSTGQENRPRMHTNAHECTQTSPCRPHPQPQIGFVSQFPHAPSRRNAFHPRPASPLSVCIRVHSWPIFSVCPPSSRALNPKIGFVSQCASPSSSLTVPRPNRVRFLQICAANVAILPVTREFFICVHLRSSLPLSLLPSPMTGAPSFIASTKIGFVSQFPLPRAFGTLNLSPGNIVIEENNTCVLP